MDMLDELLRDSGNFEMFGWYQHPTFSEVSKVREVGGTLNATSVNENGFMSLASAPSISGFAQVYISLPSTSAATP